MLPGINPISRNVAFAQEFPEPSAEVLSKLLHADGLVFVPQIQTLNKRCSTLKDLTQRCEEARNIPCKEKMVALLLALISVAFIVGIVFGVIYAPNDDSIFGIVVGGYLASAIFGKYLQEKYYKNNLELGCCAPFVLPFAGSIMPLTATLFKESRLKREKEGLEIEISNNVESLLTSFQKATHSVEKYISSSIDPDPVEYLKRIRDLLVQSFVQNFSVRAAAREDTALILQMMKEDQVVSSERTLERIEKPLDPVCPVLIVESYGKPVGFVCFFYMDKAIIITDIYVRQEFWSGDYAEKLLKEIKQLAQRSHGDRVEKWDIVGGVQAVQFYAKMEPRFDKQMVSVNDWRSSYASIYKDGANK